MIETEPVPSLHRHEDSVEQARASRNTDTFFLIQSLNAHTLLFGDLVLMSAQLIGCYRLPTTITRPVVITLGRRR